MHKILDKKIYNASYFSQLICFSLTSYLSSETDKGIIKIVLNIARNIHYQKLIKIMLNSNNRSHHAVYLFWFEIGQNSCMLIIFSGNFNIKHDIQTKVKYISMLWIKYKQKLIIDQIMIFFFIIDNLDWFSLLIIFFNSICKCRNEMIPCRINQVATGIFVTTPDPSIVIFSQIKKYKLKFIFVITYMLLHSTTLKNL